MVNYSNAKIYMIESARNGTRFYGSTCSPLSKRMWEHKDYFKQYTYGTRDYCPSFEALVRHDARIILVEAYPCKNRQELDAQEAKYIRENPCLNKDFDPTEGLCGDSVMSRIGSIMTAEKNIKKDASKAAASKYYQDTTRERKTKVLCVCGSTISKGYLPRHKKSAKHARLLKTPK